MRRKVGPKESSVKRLPTDRRETKRTEEEWNETAETKSAAAAHVRAMAGGLTPAMSGGAVKTVPRV